MLVGLGMGPQKLLRTFQARPPDRGQGETAGCGELRLGRGRPGFPHRLSPGCVTSFCDLTLSDPQGLHLSSGDLKSLKASQGCPVECVLAFEKGV